MHDSKIIVRTHAKDSHSKFKRCKMLNTSVIVITITPQTTAADRSALRQQSPCLLKLTASKDMLTMGSNTNSLNMIRDKAPITSRYLILNNLSEINYI